MARSNKCARMEEDDLEDEEKEVLYVFFDIEAMQLRGSNQPNLLVAEMGEGNQPMVFEGEDCVVSVPFWIGWKN